MWFPTLFNPPHGSGRQDSVEMRGPGRGVPVIPIPVPTDASHSTMVPPRFDLAVDSSYRRDGSVDRGESRSSVIPGCTPLQAPSGQYTRPEGRRQ